MSPMLMNLGLAPIPPTPVIHVPEPRNTGRDFDSYRTPAMLKAREKLLEKQRTMAETRRKQALAFLEIHKIARTKFICQEMRWSKSKVQCTFSSLVKEGLVRSVGISSQTKWELVCRG